MSTPAQNLKPTKKLRPIKKRKELGDCLIEAGLIDEKTLARALEIQKGQEKRLGQVLIDMGVADYEVIGKALARQFNIPFLRLDKTKIPEEITSLVPAGMAENYLVIPVERTGNRLLVAMADPADLYAIDDLRFVTQMPIDVAVASQEDVLEAIGRHYPKQDLQQDLDSDPGIDEDIEIIRQVEKEEADVHDLLKLTELPPVVRLTNAILVDAVKLKASDIHVEPQETSVLIRYRIDGIMREIVKTDKRLHASLVSRMKVISNMDISIRRKPQDGRSQIKWANKTYDLRVSTIPTSYGEKVTIRILPQDTEGIRLEGLGIEERAFDDLAKAISKPQGIILVTGPTGSGKSSTLYACLNRLNTPLVNIITVEDPIEFRIPGINQMQINPKAGVTFSAGLRSILRQDPDIVMVGEIRDSETASIAFQAGQTGHLVLSTLHTNDASSAITRLMDLGVAPFLISASLIAVVGQRLARKICPECKAPDCLSPQIIERLPLHNIGKETTTFWKGIGCEACQYTGYTGRLGLFEILTVTPSLTEIIAPNVSALTIKKAAEREGFQSMSMDGIRKALQGLTTIEEVLRVAPPEADEVPQVPIVEPPVPEDTPAEAFPSEERPASVASVQPKKILVADDNEIILKVLCNVLESENYLVTTAKDGLEAFKLAVQEKPDLIITDLLMPKMDGITLIEKLKSQLSTRYIPIIMHTAKDEVDSEVKGIDAGADDYLTKPVKAKRLLSRINRLLSRHQ